eukprot:COSAG06_NODE_3037_length_5932_cov_39.020744_4_plen_134_part_00
MEGSVGSGHLLGEGLLGEDVVSLLERLDRGVDVQGRRQGVDDHVKAPRVEHLAPVVVDLAAELLLGLGAAHLQLVRDLQAVGERRLEAAAATQAGGGRAEGGGRGKASGHRTATTTNFSATVSTSLMQRTWML